MRNLTRRLIIRRQILLVEDDWLLAEEMQTLLEGIGATVIGPAGNPR